MHYLAIYKCQYIRPLQLKLKKTMLVWPIPFVKGGVATTKEREGGVI